MRKEEEKIKANIVDDSGDHIGVIKRKRAVVQNSAERGKPRLSRGEAQPTSHVFFTATVAYHQKRYLVPKNEILPC